MNFRVDCTEIFSRMYCGGTAFSSSRYQCRSCRRFRWSIYQTDEHFPRAKNDTLYEASGRQGGARTVLRARPGGTCARSRSISSAGTSRGRARQPSFMQDGLPSYRAGKAGKGAAQEMWKERGAEKGRGRTVSLGAEENDRHAQAALLAPSALKNEKMFSMNRHK